MRDRIVLHSTGVVEGIPAKSVLKKTIHVPFSMICVYSVSTLYSFLVQHSKNILRLRKDSNFYFGCSTIFFSYCSPSVQLRL